MMLALRLFFGLAVALHIGLKLFWPGYLSTGPWEDVAYASHFSWWLIIFLVLAIPAAFLLTPQYAGLVQWFASYGLVPIVFFVLLLVGILWLTNILWGITVAKVCDTCAKDFVGQFTMALGGG